MKSQVKFFAVIAIFATSPAFAEVNSGTRVEVFSGYDNISIDTSDYGLGKYDKSGITFGIGIGYDIAAGENFALGLDAEFSDSSTNYVFDDGTEYLKISTGRDLYIGARGTVAASKALNIYAKAGYTNTRLKLTYDDGSGIVSDSGNGDGIRAGIGGQLALGEKAYASAEYRYSNYEADFSRSQVLVGLGYRF